MNRKLIIDNYIKYKFPNMKWEFYKVGFIRVYNPINNKIIDNNIPISTTLLLSKQVSA